MPFPNDRLAQVLFLASTCAWHSHAACCRVLHIVMEGAFVPQVKRVWEMETLTKFMCVLLYVRQMRKGCCPIAGLVMWYRCEDGCDFAHGWYVLVCTSTRREGHVYLGLNHEMHHEAVVKPACAFFDAVFC